MNQQKLEKYLKYTINTCLFIIPFVVLFMFSGLFFPYITTKAFVFRFLVQISFTAWLVLAYLNSSYRPKLQPILIAVLSFVGVVLLADIFGVNPGRSLWSNFERMEGFIALFHLLLYFIVLSSVFIENKNWLWFLRSNVLASILVSGYGLLQLAGALPIQQGGVRLDSTLGNAGYLGTYMFFSIFITLYLALVDGYFKSNKLVAGVYSLVLLLQGFILYQTATRGAMLGLLFGLLASSVVLVIFGGAYRKLRLVAGVVLLSVFLLIGGFWLIKDSSFVTENPVLTRFASISLEEATTKSRFTIWQMAWQGVKERPILGWGQENFIVVFSKYYDPEMYNQEPWFDRSHNVFFDWLIAAGFLGLLSYLSLFGVCLYYLFKIKDEILSIPAKAILIGLLSGYFFQNLFIFDNLISYILFFTIISYLAYLYHQNKIEIIKNKNKLDTNQLLISLLLVGLMMVFSYQTLIKPLTVNIYLIEGLKSINLFQQGAQPRGQISYPEIALSNIEKVFKMNTFGSIEAGEQLVRMALPILVNEEVDQSIKIKFLSLIKNHFEQRLNDDPQDVRGRVLYSSFLVNQGDFNSALAYLNQARQLSPNRQLIILEQAKVYFLVGSTTEALALTKEVFDDTPDLDEARRLYGFILADLGKMDESMSVLEPLIFASQTDQSIVNFYTQRGEFDLLIDIWNERIRLYPDDPQNYFYLAGTYYNIGNVNQSINILEQTKNLFPQTINQADGLIDQMKNI